MKERFINRTEELAQLNEQYESKASALSILYGRRRLGKTALIKEFVQDKPFCYFMADRAGEKLQRANFAQALSDSLNEPLLGEVDYASWYEVFKAFDRFRNKKQRWVLVLDEYQYLCEVETGFSSFIQKWWDEHWKQDNIMVILCGSVTSMMYRETMEYSSPLYGRSSLQILVSPLNYSYLAEFFPKLTSQELVEMYSLTGGVPRYIELAQPHKIFKKALEKLVLNRFGLLNNEAKYLLQEEIQTPNTYWSILHAIGSGATRVSEISSRLEMPTSKIARYLDLLRDLFMIERITPILETKPSKSKKGIYTFKDPFLRLWFGCIFPYQSLLEFSDADKVYKKILPQIDSNTAFVYEELCRNFVQARMTEFGLLRVGSQWGKNYEIDVAGINENGDLALVGECKWSRSKVGVSILEHLKKTVIGQKLPVVNRLKYLLFSKSGFSSDLHKLAEIDKNIVLVADIF